MGDVESRGVIEGLRGRFVADGPDAGADGCGGVAVVLQRRREPGGVAGDAGGDGDGERGPDRGREANRRVAEGGAFSIFRHEAAVGLAADGRHQALEDLPRPVGADFHVVGPRGARRGAAVGGVPDGVHGRRGAAAGRGDLAADRAATLPGRDRMGEDLEFVVADDRIGTEHGLRGDGRPRECADVCAVEVRLRLVADVGLGRRRVDGGARRGGGEPPSAVEKAIGVVARGREEVPVRVEERIFDEVPDAFALRLEDAVGGREESRAAGRDVALGVPPEDGVPHRHRAARDVDGEAVGRVREGAAVDVHGASSDIELVLGGRPDEGAVGHSQRRA